MSSYDDRVVRMGFDNAKFEAGASKTMTTLDKLNEKLKLKGASEGGENIQKSISKVDFSSMERSIEAIERRFSTMGIVGINVINKITNGIAGSVKQLEQATIGQIKSGGWSRAMNIANAKFQIEGLGFAWEEVEKAVSYGVKDTAYGLDAAASAASQLAASGVDFKKVLDTVNGQELTAMHKSLRAISGVAAMTNSSYEEIAKIFTTVAGNGRLMGDQLLQLSSRGMNAAAKLAETLGTTEADIRDMVSRGLIDFQTFAFAMDDAFGDHAKEANKTFTGALGNMKAALSRVGEIFTDPIINKTNTLFISLTERIDEFKNKLKSVTVPKSFEEIKKEYGDIHANAAAYDAILKSNGEKVVTLGKHFAEMWQSGIDAFSKMIAAVDLSWFDKIVVKVDDVIVKIKEFFDLIKDVYSESAEEAADEINEATKTLVVSAEEAQAAKDVILKGMYGTGAKRSNALAELFGGGEEGKKHAKNVQAYIDSVVAAGWSFEKASIQVADANELVADSIKEVEQEEKKAKLKEHIESIRVTAKNLFTTVKNLATAAYKAATIIISAFAKVFKMDLSSITGGAKTLSELIANLSKKLIISDDAVETVQGGFEKFFGMVKKGGEWLKSAGENALGFIKAFKDTEVVESAKDTFSSLWASITGLKDSSLFTSIKDNISSLFDGMSIDGIKEKISGLFGVFKGSDGPKDGAAEQIEDETVSYADKLKNALEYIKSIPEKISTFAENVKNAIGDLDAIDVGKFAAKVLGIIAVVKLFISLNDLSKMLIDIQSLPEKLAGVFGKFSTLLGNLGTSAVNASKALIIKAAAWAIVEVALVLIAISRVPEKDIYRAASILVLMTGIIALLAAILGRSADALGKGKSAAVTVNNSARASIQILTKTAALFVGIGVVVTAIGLAIAALTAAFVFVNKMVADGMITKDGVWAFIKILLTFVGLTAGIFWVANWLRDQLEKAWEIVPTMLGMSALMTAVAGAVLLIAVAASIAGNLDPTSLGSAVSIIGVALAGMIAIVYLASKVDYKQVLATSALMLSIGTAVTLMAIAMGIIGLASPSEDTVNAILTLLGVTTIMFAAIALLSKLVSKDSATLTGTVVMVLAFETLFLAIASALFVISKIKDVQQAADVLNSVMGVFALITLILGGLAAVVAITGNEKVFDGLRDMLLSLSLGVISVAAAMLVLGIALEKLGNVDSGILIGFLVVLGIFTVAIGVLIGVAAAMPQVAIAMEAVGNMFLRVGVGAALVGAGFYFIAAAIAKLAPWIGVLAIDMDKLFDVITEHKAVALAFGVFILLLVGELTIAIVAFSRVLSGLVESIGNAVVMILGAVNSGKKAVEDKLDKDKKGLSTKAKQTIVTVIITLCAAILQASPTVLDTIGKLIIKLFAYLGKISGTLARAIVDFLIELIYGVTDAIMLNSDRIAAAFWGLFMALVDVGVQVWGQIITWILRVLGDITGIDWFEKAGDKVSGWTNKLSVELLTRSHEMRVAAEEASKAKNEYAESALGMAAANSEAADRMESSTEKLKKTLGIGSQETAKASADLQDLKKEYDGLPGYAYDAILNSQNAQKAANQSGKDVGNAFGDGFSGVITGFGGGGGSWGDDLNAGNVLDGANWNEEYMQAHGSSASTSLADSMSQPKEYSASMDENMGGVVSSIRDNQEPVEDAIHDHINVPANAKIRGNRTNMFDAAIYMAGGVTEALTSQQAISMYQGAMIAYANAGQAAFLSQKGIDANSPSKKFYKFGTYIVSGLCNALNANQSSVADSMIGLSDAVVNSFGSPFERIGKIASGELKYDASIRPTFDNSGLYGGANSIDGMIQSQTISVAGLSGRLSADIGRLDGTNADMVAQLQALRDEMAVMTDEMTNMQVVMDTGALVGQMAGPLDRNMGQRAVYKRRGN